MTQEIEEFVSECNDLLQESMAFSIMCRDASLQKSMSEKLKSRLEEISQLKLAAACDGFDDIANMLLGTGCALGSVLACIQMCLNLKKDKPHDAWRSLVAAQRAVRGSMRAHSGCENMTGLSEYLSQVEHCLFPPQVFTSLGASYGESFCSICDADYGSCDHIAGLPYAGEFCSIIIRNSVVEEISIVDQPEDKSCIITAFGDADGTIKDRLSLMPVPPEKTNLNDV